MNEVSIIINGVRYDAVQTEEYNACHLCEIRDLTQLKSGGCICNVLMLPYDVVFKKSDKKRNDDNR